jgi:molybdate transport system ATP-binding protein
LVCGVPERRLSVGLKQPGPIPLDVEFECAAGQVLAIFGPSGSGKTTILRAIAGLYRPERASVRSNGAAWTDTPSQTFVPPHRRAVGFVFQEYALFPHLTAEGNVAAALGHLPSAGRDARARDLLRSVRLDDKATRRPHELSGGERQRVAIARALAREPEVLLLDEPFAAVDRQVRRALQEEVTALRRTLDLPMILVTHDFDDVVRLASHVLLLERGHGVACGPVTTLMSRPDLAWLREAVGLGAVIDATVSGSTDHGLMLLAFDGGTLLAADRGLPTGAAVRVRIPAREVILATRAPEGLSLHNVLAGRVSALHADPGIEHVIVQVAVGRTLVLAEVTRDAVERLNLAAGTPIHALVKSVSIDVVTAGSGLGARGSADTIAPWYRAGDALRSAVEYLSASSPAFNWVGVYLLKGDTLELGPYIGAATEHTRIKVGVGVCGTAIARNADMNVPDVTAADNYLACSAETRSELVVLIRDPAGTVVGQIDIDSHTPAAFGPPEEQLVREVAETLGARWVEIYAQLQR